MNKLHEQHDTNKDLNMDQLLIYALCCHDISVTSQWFALMVGIRAALAAEWGNLKLIAIYTLCEN